MKILLTVLMLSGIPAWAASNSGAALADFQKRQKSPGFSESWLAPSDALFLRATDLYVSSSAAARKGWLTEAFASWRDSLRVSGLSEEGALIAVVEPEGGTLWRWANGLKPVDRWSERELAHTEAGSKGGRIFGFFGGQMVTGGAVDSTGFNARLGSTLLDNRYDFAVAIGHTSLDTSPSMSVQTYGLVGRALYPLSRYAGYNLGAQVSRSIPSQGDAVNTLTGLAGLNFFVPGGSFDVTLQAGNNSTYGVLVGYTFYFTRTPPAPLDK